MTEAEFGHAAIIFVGVLFIGFVVAMISLALFDIRQMRQEDKRARRGAVV